jgi:hypothetical protein
MDLFLIQPKFICHQIHIPSQISCLQLLILLMYISKYNFYVGKYLPHKNIDLNGRECSTTFFGSDTHKTGLSDG